MSGLGEDKYSEELQKLKGAYMLISLISITVGNLAKLDYFRFLEGFDRLEQLTDSLPSIEFPKHIIFYLENYFVVSTVVPESQLELT